MLTKNHGSLGSGCGSVGRAVASDTKGPRFESSHRANITFVYCQVNWLDKNKEKELRNGEFKINHGCFGHHIPTVSSSHPGWEDN